MDEEYAEPGDGQEEQEWLPDQDAEQPDLEYRYAPDSGDEVRAEGDLSTSDLEEAYLRALEAMETAEWAVPEVASEAVEDSVAVPADELSQPVDADGTATTPTVAQGSGEAPAEVQEIPASPKPSGVMAQADLADVAEGDTPITTARVVEACLFVGGAPLPAKKLAGVVEGNFEPGAIEGVIDELNLEYAAQKRPYEIRQVDGGYRMALRTEFESIRSRVYGVGPRDVKLSQDVLEVLALIAYQQPIAQNAIEACKPNSANLLRQLLRRELISLTRIDQSRNGVEYRTTPRFLQLFGLGQLSELPRSEDLSIR